jgi:hypothetical protein
MGCVAERPKRPSSNLARIELPRYMQKLAGTPAAAGARQGSDKDSPPSTLPFISYLYIFLVSGTVAISIAWTKSPGMITTLVKTEVALGEHRFGAVIPTRATLPQSTAPYLSLTTSTLAPTKLCPVCYQAACPLRSHKQYARYRRLEEIASATDRRQSSSGFGTSSSVESLDSDEIFHHRLIEIGATKVDTFFDFPLPKGIKAEVHQLFQDCKPQTCIPIFPPSSFMKYDFHSSLAQLNTRFEGVRLTRPSSFYPTPGTINYGA